MATTNNRITLDLDAKLQSRLKAAAACKGVSISEYCRTAIDHEVARDEANTASSTASHGQESPVLFGDAGEIRDPRAAVERFRQAQARRPETGMTLEEALAARHEGHRF